MERRGPFAFWPLLDSYGTRMQALLLPDFTFDAFDVANCCPNLRSLNLDNVTIRGEVILPVTLEKLAVNQAAFGTPLDLSRLVNLRVLSAINTSDIIVPIPNSLEVVCARGTDCLTLATVANPHLRELGIQGDDEFQWHMLARTALESFAFDRLRNTLLSLSDSFPGTLSCLQFSDLPLHTVRITRAPNLHPSDWAAILQRHNRPWISFDVRECEQFDSVPCAVFADKCMHHGTQLRYLNLSWCYYLKDADVFGVLEQVPRLKVLKLMGVRFITHHALVPILTTPYWDLQRLDVTSSDNVEDWFLELLHVVYSLKVDIHSDLSAMSANMRDAVELVRSMPHSTLRIKNYYGLEIEEFKPLPPLYKVLEVAQRHLFP